MAYYAITDQEFGVSRKTGCEMITLTLYDLETREEFRSYVDSSMQNFEQWAEIITQPEKGWVITGVKKKRSYGRYTHEIINADSEPVIVAEYPDARRMFKNLKQYWAQEDFKKTAFGQLFGDGK